MNPVGRWLDRQKGTMNMVEYKVAAYQNGAFLGILTRTAFEGEAIRTMIKYKKLNPHIIFVVEK